MTAPANSQMTSVCFRMARIIPAILMAGSILVVIGCQSSSENNDGGGEYSQPDGAQNSQTAEQIVAGLKSKYSSLENYSDEAKLHISYRINGQLMEEHHPWQVTFQRPRKLSSKLFNARIKSDGEMLTCFVYDFPSSNLDNQFLVLDSQNKLPLNQLLTDSIARHFVAGQTELPINGKRPLAFESFVPPTLALLSGEPELKWMKSEHLERLDDRNLDDVDCYQVAVRRNDLEFKLLVDQQSGLLYQVEYPIELLDEELQNSDLVEDLRLFARFENSQTDTISDEQVFNTELPDGVKTVSQFIAIPEKFPCDSIGDSLATLKIKDMGGFPVTGQQWKGRVTTLIWMDEALAAYNAEDLNSLASEFDRQDFNFAIVLIGELTNNNNIAKLVANDINILMDERFEIGSKIGLQMTPAAVVLDRDGNIQFTQSMSNWSGWQKKLPAAITRIRQGDKIAVEMRRQYDLFLEQYRRRLAESNPFQNVNHLTTKPNRFFESTKKWHLGTIKLPGNIARLYGDSNSVLVSEGFQSVAIIGPAGNLVSRSRIPIDDSETISVTRVNHGRNPKQAFAMFSTLGPHLLILSESFEKVAKLPGDSTQTQIVDATWIPVEGESRIAMALHNRNEIIHGELDGGSLSSITLPKPAKSIAVIDSNMKTNEAQFTVISCLLDGSLIAVQSDESDSESKSIELSDQTGDWVKARSFVANAPDSSPNQTSFVVIGPDNGGGWMASGFDSAYARKWRIPIREQHHETQIQPIAHCNSPDLPGGVWAIAGSDGLVTLISDDGRFADTLDLGFIPSGIELALHNEEITLLASGEDGVAAWSVSVPNHVAAFDQVQQGLR